MSLNGKPYKQEDIELTNDGFFPPVNVGVLQAKYRVSASFKAELIERQMAHALFIANQALKAAKSAWQDQGYALLADVPSDQLNGQSVLIQLYNRAVYSLTKAMLFPEYASMNRRESSEKLLEDGPMSEEHYRTDYYEAVNLLIQQSPIDDETKPDTTRWGVALI